MNKLSKFIFFICMSIIFGYFSGFIEIIDGVGVKYPTLLFQYLTEHIVLFLPIVMIYFYYLDYCKKKAVYKGEGVTHGMIIISLLGITVMIISLMLNLNLSNHLLVNDDSIDSSQGEKLTVEAFHATTIVFYVYILFAALAIPSIDWLKSKRKFNKSFLKLLLISIVIHFVLLIAHWVFYWGGLLL